jgi:hypothetical protein
MLIYDHNAFNKCKPKPSDNGNISYRCVYYQTKGIKCNSSCSMKRLPNVEEIMILSPKEHIGNGKYTDAAKCFKKAAAEIKVKCEEPDQNYDKVKPNRIFNKVVESYMKINNITLRNEVAKEMPQYKNYKKQFFQSIDKPKEAPKSTNDITFDDSFYTETADFRRFLLFDTNDDDRIICHATDSQLQCLSLSKIWHVDGTLKHATGHYYQFYTISAWYDNDMYPCAFVQLINKSSQCYRKMLDKLVEYSNHPLRPSVS